MSSKLVLLLAALALAGSAMSGAPSPDAATSVRPVPTPSYIEDPDSGAEMIGRPAPAWTFDRWLRTRPLTLERLRGKVVLLRWWTEGCHFCQSTLPVLESLQSEHAKDGLVVVGVFHPKPPHDVSDAHILKVAKKLGFSGAIALDRDWHTLNRYWLDADPERSWTSVSFLIDRDGVIRWVHGGGEYHPSDDPAHQRCAAQYAGLEHALALALAAKPTVP